MNVLVIYLHVIMADQEAEEIDVNREEMIDAVPLTMRKLYLTVKKYQVLTEVSDLFLMLQILK